LPPTQVPDMVVARLPLYLRTLEYLQRQGVELISSAQLAELAGVSPAQIRKDLSHFGRFGKQGTGYDVLHLRRELIRILGLDRQWPMALVGLGALGQAIMHYGGFKERGFHIAAVFDSDPDKIGKQIGDLVVMPPERIPHELPKRQIQIGIVAVPPEAAQSVANLLVRSGVRAILNYAPITLSAPPEVHVEQIDPVVHLQHMVYYLRHCPQ